ncbi:MAG TPA: DUF1203 domain-containing protein [Terriglobales bacterium]|nr:DUF1203 domain-containing protein [Terriglobales bacterium]
MKGIRVIAIPTTLAEKVRATGKAPGYGHPAHTEVATGYGPCRHCLRTFKVGEEKRTLFTYDPFHDLETMPLPGPIFIHADACIRYPEDGGYPEQMLLHSSVLAAYGKGRRLVAELQAENGGQMDAIQKLLEDPGVDYIHVRDRSAGCYDFRIERNMRTTLETTC